VDKCDFLLVGVGGQGTLLCSDIVAATGLQAGYDVKKSEVHGMAQRGGSVTSHVRWAEHVFSPLIGRGEADLMLALVGALSCFVDVPLEHWLTAISLRVPERTVEINRAAFVAGRRAVQPSTPR
jgi:Pyruvate/2-oxoacid:ferredoxin oxidoreductase gamma subunit